MQYQATVTIEQKAGMLDPEGTTAKRLSDTLDMQSKA